MAQNTLKQKAREFAKTHSVPYLTALKAVDEPLHGLRDLIYRIGQSDVLQPHFRLIGDGGPFSPAFPRPREEPHEIWGEHSATLSYHRDLIISEGFPMLSEAEFFIELGRRTELIRNNGAEDIWDYRELQRAGLLGEIPVLEPAFHYYSMGLSSTFGAAIPSGAEFGIFTVNMAPLRQITEYYHLFPLTLSQMAALQSGEDIEPLEFPLNHMPTENEPSRRWNESYVAAYNYYDRRIAKDRHPQLLVLLRSPVEDIEAELSSRGLDFSHFHEEEDFTLGIELEHILSRDMLQIKSPERTRWIATDSLLILG